MKTSIRKSIAHLLAVILVIFPFNLSIKASTYLDKSVFEAGENHFVYLCPEDTNDIIINWRAELFAALNLQGKWALYDFYGTQLTDYIFDGFYNVLYENYENDFTGMAAARFMDENVKCYIGNEDYILTRDQYAIVSIKAVEIESHNPDYPDYTPSTDVTDHDISALFDKITPSEEMPFTAAYALKDFVLVENDENFTFGILSYDGEIVLPMDNKSKGYSFLNTLKYGLFLRYFTISENRYVVFDSDGQKLADIPLIPYKADGSNYGYIGKTGLTIPCKYTYAGFFHDGLASVTIDSFLFGGMQDNSNEPSENEQMIGYIDTSGGVALEFYTHEVSALYDFYDGLALFSSPESINPSSLLYSPSNIFYMDKTGRVVIKQPIGDNHGKWLSATGFKNSIAIVTNRIDDTHGQGMWVIRHTDGGSVEDAKFLPRTEYLAKYFGFPDDKNIMSVISTGIYKGQEILTVTDYPPNDERLFLRLFVD